MGPGFIGGYLTRETLMEKSLTKIFEQMVNIFLLRIGGHITLLNLLIMIILMKRVDCEVFTLKSIEVWSLFKTGKWYLIIT